MIKEKFQECYTSQDEILNYLTDPSLKFFTSNTQLLGFVKKDGIVSQIRYPENSSNIFSSHSKLLGEINAIGSGREDADDILFKMNSAAASVEKSDTGSMNEIERATQVALALCSLLYFEEIRLSPRSSSEQKEGTLYSGYGAGYEVVMHTQDGLVRPSNILLLFWIINPQELQLVEWAIQFSNVDDKLIVQRLELASEGTICLRLDDTWCPDDLPLSEGIMTRKIMNFKSFDVPGMSEDSDFRNKVLITGCIADVAKEINHLVLSQDGKGRCFSLYQPHNNGVSLVEQDGEFFICFEKSFVDYLYKIGRSRLS